MLPDSGTALAEYGEGVEKLLEGMRDFIVNGVRMERKRVDARAGFSVLAVLMAYRDTYNYSGLGKVHFQCLFAHSVWQRRDADAYCLRMFLVIRSTVWDAVVDCLRLPAAPPTPKVSLSAAALVAESATTAYVVSALLVNIRKSLPYHFAELHLPATFENPHDAAKIAEDFINELLSLSSVVAEPGSAENLTQLRIAMTPDASPVSSSLTSFAATHVVPILNLVSLEAMRSTRRIEIRSALYRGVAGDKSSVVSANGNDFVIQCSYAALALRAAWFTMLDVECNDGDDGFVADRILELLFRKLMRTRAKQLMQWLNNNRGTKTTLRETVSVRPTATARSSSSSSSSSSTSSSSSSSSSSARAVSRSQREDDYDEYDDEVAASRTDDDEYGVNDDVLTFLRGKQPFVTRSGRKVTVNERYH